MVHVLPSLSTNVLPSSPIFPETLTALLIFSAFMVSCFIWSGLAGFLSECQEGCHHRKRQRNEYQLFRAELLSKTILGGTLSVCWVLAFRFGP
jgi:hypothetical protein